MHGHDDQSANHTCKNHRRDCVHPNVLHGCCWLAQAGNFMAGSCRAGGFFFPCRSVHSCRVHHAIYLQLCTRQAEGRPLWFWKVQRLCYSGLRYPVGFVRLSETSWMQLHRPQSQTGWNRRSVCRASSKRPAIGSRSLINVLGRRGTRGRCMWFWRPANERTSRIVLV